MILSLLNRYQAKLTAFFLSFGGNFLFKDNNGNTETLCEIRSKLTLLLF